MVGGDGGGSGGGGRYVKRCLTTCHTLWYPPVPHDFHGVLRSLTEEGLRVIAVGHRTMQLAWHKSERIER